MYVIQPHLNVLLLLFCAVGRPHLIISQKEFFCFSLRLSFLEPRDYRVVFVIQKDRRFQRSGGFDLRLQGLCAAGRTRPQPSEINELCVQTSPVTRMELDRLTANRVGACHLSRLPARSALQKAAPFEVSTGDPRPAFGEGKDKPVAVGPWPTLSLQVERCSRPRVAGRRR